MPYLSTRDKLAIMMTAAGSQRKLAGALGISHQKLGRWLREGEPAIIDPETGDVLRQAGAKRIPDAFDVSPEFNALWRLHTETARSQAKAHGLPFDARIPLYFFRKPMHSGVLGSRAYVESAQYLGPRLRTDWLDLMHYSQRFAAASVRSEINIFSYTGALKEPNPFATSNDRGKARRYKYESVRDSAEDIIRHGGKTIPLFTKYQNFLPGTEGERSIRGVEYLLKKHEPHAVNLADQLLLQLIPATYEAPKKTAKKRPGKRGRAVRGNRR